MHVSNKFLLTLFCFSIMQYPPASHTMGLPLSPLSLSGIWIWRHWASDIELSQLTLQHYKGVSMVQNWLMIITEQHRYQGVSYKSDIIVISGLDKGDRKVLQQKYSKHQPPCLLDTSDGRWETLISVNTPFYTPVCVRFVLKGVNYNPVEVMNVLSSSRGYKLEGEPQQRTLPSIHIKDDK